MSGLSNTLCIYRRLLTLARSFPDEKKRLTSVTQLREAFRNNSGESEREKIREMLVKAQSTLSYLKIVTPRSQSHEQQLDTRVNLGEAGGRVQLDGQQHGPGLGGQALALDEEGGLQEQCTGQGHLLTTF
jgi:hypothetical protein